MKTGSEEGPYTFVVRQTTSVELSFERKTVVRQSSAAETTQLFQSNESCEKLRRKRYDETGNLIGATPLTGGLVGCWHVCLVEQTTECGLFLTCHLFSKALKNYYSCLQHGAVAQGESTTLKT